jgi:phosphotransferase system enzyme I (PtsI)
VKIPVSVCGEMAADPFATVLLVGFGLNELSVAPKMIPEIKRIIKTIKFKDAKRISKRALVFKTQDEVKNFLMKELKGIIPEIEI